MKLKYNIVYSIKCFAGNGGTEGKWGDWSESCDDGSAICGVAVRFEEPNYFDETALGDAVFYCCDDS